MSNNSIKFKNLKKKSLNFKSYTIFSNKLHTYATIDEATVWYENEIVNASKSIDLLEKSCDIHSNCFKGCNSCCNQAIYLCSAEYELLKHYLSNFDSTSKNMLKEYSLEICSKIDKNKIPLFYASIPPNEIQTQINEEYFKLNLPCPFLKNNICSIYNIRPIICWTYRYYNNVKNCSINSKFELPHMLIGAYVEQRMNQYITTHSDEFYLLPYAVCEIL